VEWHWQRTCTELRHNYVVHAHSHLLSASCTPQSSCRQKPNVIALQSCQWLACSNNVKNMIAKHLQSAWSNHNHRYCLFLHSTQCTIYFFLYKSFWSSLKWSCTSLAAILKSLVIFILFLIVRRPWPNFVCKGRHTSSVVLVLVLLLIWSLWVPK